MQVESVRGALKPSPKQYRPTLPHCLAILTAAAERERYGWGFPSYNEIVQVIKGVTTNHSF